MKTALLIELPRLSAKKQNHEISDTSCCTPIPLSPTNALLDIAKNLSTFFGNYFTPNFAIQWGTSKSTDQRPFDSKHGGHAYLNSLSGPLV